MKILYHPIRATAPYNYYTRMYLNSLGRVIYTNGLPSQLQNSQKSSNKNNGSPTANPHVFITAIAIASTARDNQFGDVVVVHYRFLPHPR